jgi:hypothetical protein
MTAVDDGYAPADVGYSVRREPRRQSECALAPALGLPQDDAVRWEFMRGRPLRERILVSPRRVAHMALAPGRHAQKIRRRAARRYLICLGWSCGRS